MLEITANLSFCNIDNKTYFFHGCVINFKALFTDRNLLEKLMPFYQFCAVKKLSDCINVEAITEMFEPCPELQMYMHLAVPIVQRYLYKYNPDIYQEVQNQNMSQRLAAMQFYKVGVLYAC